MIIGVSGKKQSGKDTIGKIIQYLTSESRSIMSYEEYQTSQSKFRYDSKFEIKKFADKPKDMVSVLIDCTREQLEDETFKNTELGEEWEKWYWYYYKMQTNKNSTGRVSKYYNTQKECEADFIKLSKTFDISLSFTYERLTPRKLLQLIGTNCGRDIIHPNIWINSTLNKYKALDPENGQSMLNEIDYGRCKFPKWIITDVRFPNELKAIEVDDSTIEITLKKR